MEWSTLSSSGWRRCVDERVRFDGHLGKMRLLRYDAAMPVSLRPTTSRLLTLAAAAAVLASLPLFAQPQQRNRQNADLLTEEQVNTIRVTELQSLDLRDPPRIRFANRVIQRYVEARPDLTFRGFNSQPDVTKALTILANGSQEERADIEIATDPISLAVFKRDVHPAILQGCATSACHGSDDASANAGFRLYTDDRSDETIYTNFHTLVKTTVGIDNPSGSAFGGPAVVERRLIDRQNPDASLLLEYMLPREQADVPHPEVEGLRPMVPTDRAPLYQGVRRWINAGLKKGVTGYGFEGEAEPAEAQAEAQSEADTMEDGQ
jgi:hypothetical protein